MGIAPRDGWGLGDIDDDHLQELIADNIDSFLEDASISLTYYGADGNTIDDQLHVMCIVGEMCNMIVHVPLIDVIKNEADSYGDEVSRKGLRCDARSRFGGRADRNDRRDG